MRAKTELPKIVDADVLERNKSLQTTLYDQKHARVQTLGHKYECAFQKRPTTQANIKK